MGLIGEVGDLPMQIALALLATLFTLLMSNVGATVLLVPIAINIALATGADPTIYALIIALGTSNAFILPTHPTNALIMGPGGYTVKDFLRVGLPISVIYLVVLLVMVNLVF
jgi:di/tricarboxylate transporter